MYKDKITVFLVDDSVDDRLFMRKSLERSSKFVIIGEAADGQEILDYLSDDGLFKDRQTYPIPDLLLLDLKMPRKNGFDVLEWLKKRAFTNLIVAVVSGSSLPADITKSLALGASGYFRKSSIREEQEAMVKHFEALVEKKSH